MFWGHPLSIVVVEKNKIVRNLDEAFQRIRNIIAPTHFRIRSGELGGRKRETPCVAWENAPTAGQRIGDAIFSPPSKASLPKPT